MGGIEETVWDRFNRLQTKHAIGWGNRATKCGFIILIHAPAYWFFDTFLHGIVVILLCNFQHVFGLFKLFYIYFPVDPDIFYMTYECQTEFIIKPKNKWSIFGILILYNLLKYINMHFRASRDVFTPSAVLDGDYDVMTLSPDS